eukprot:GGOE01002177.1.p1 GENE.GGOE01002177.1~~GGOE01002177.1.p1  ORF type:complete len:121 (+),score=18.70 GGOE01002177.1:24-365(+)
MDDPQPPFITHASLKELAAQVDPRYELDDEVADILVELADTFVESAIRFGSKLARHRGDDTLRVKDISLYLERVHGLRVPGFVPIEPPAKLQKRSAESTPAAAPDCSKALRRR